MRYNLESTLPINAFSPRGGRGPFSYGMTLEGGNPLEGVTDAISGVLGTDGGGGGILGAVEDIGQSIGGALADVDDFVGDEIPGGWSTVAAVAVPFAAPYAGAALGLMAPGTALTAGQAAAIAAGTSGATSAIRGEKIEDILKNAAISGATAYGLSSLGGAGSGGENISLPSETPYVDLLDEGTLLTTPNIASPTYYESLRLPSEMPYVDVPDGELLLSRNAIPSVSADDIYNDQFIRAFENPQISELPAFEPTASITSSDVPSPDLVRAQSAAFTPEQYQAQYEAQDVMQQARSVDIPQGTPGSAYNQVPSPAASSIPNISYDADSGIKITDYSTPASAETEKMVQMGMLERAAELPGAAYDMTKSYISANPYTAAALGLGALTLGDKILQGKLFGGSDSQSQSSQSQQKTPSSSARTRFKTGAGGYGSAGEMYDNYRLRDRVNAGNVYEYRGPSYAEGGEVKRFGLGGLSSAITRFTQPIEKAVIQPIGNAVPFLREAAPYAGLIAAPFISSPMMAAGVGALSSGFGTPGSGFNMKRAMMGGMAAYGMSNIGAGIEAAGTPAAASTGTGFTTGAVDAALSQPDVATGFFRNPDAMAAGIKNLAGGSTYGPAAAQFATKAGLPSAGMALMGTSGVMAVDEGIKQQADYDAASSASQSENQEVLNRIAAGKKRAEQAVRENPYMYAMGGSVDDESGMDEARGLMQGNLQKGMFGMGFAAGGMPSLALSRLSQPAFNEGAVGGMPQFAAGGQPRFLSGGGDGMSDSIKATIEGNQEARLADGEFVIPADVVSHLGNGSSKAGAKQLYSMMDRVRQARVGTKKQGREIKPKKFMPA